MVPVATTLLFHCPLKAVMNKHWQMGVAKFYNNFQRPSQFAKPWSILKISTTS